MEKKNKHCSGCRADTCGAVCPWYVEEMRLHFGESDAQAELDDALMAALEDAGFSPEDFDE